MPFDPSALSWAICSSLIFPLVEYKYGRSRGFLRIIGEKGCTQSLTKSRAGVTKIEDGGQPATSRKWFDQDRMRILQLTYVRCACVGWDKDAHNSYVTCGLVVDRVDHYTKR